MSRVWAWPLIIGLIAVGTTLGTTSASGESERPIRVPFGTVKGPTQVVVAKGDHLWKISDRHLASVLGREASRREISPYWRLVIEANHESLKSGDPDLIYPGEVVTLPPLP